jgi:hypothetical protein
MLNCAKFYKYTHVRASMNIHTHILTIFCMVCIATFEPSLPLLTPTDITVCTPWNTQFKVRNTSFGWMMNLSKQTWKSSTLFKLTFQSNLTNVTFWEKWFVNFCCFHTIKCDHLTSSIIQDLDNGFHIVTPWPEYSLFSLLFWLGQGVTWVMYAFVVLSMGFLGFWGCLLSRCLYMSMVA